MFRTIHMRINWFVLQCHRELVTAGSTGAAFPAVPTGSGTDSKYTPPGIEPGTSCTRSKNHTTRPRSQLIHDCMREKLATRTRNLFRASLLALLAPQSRAAGLRKNGAVKSHQKCGKSLQWLGLQFGRDTAAPLRWPHCTSSILRFPVFALSSCHPGVFFVV